MISRPGSSEGAGDVSHQQSSNSSSTSRSSHNRRGRREKEREHEERLKQREEAIRQKFAAANAIMSRVNDAINALEERRGCWHVTVQIGGPWGELGVSQGLGLGPDLQAAIGLRGDRKRARVRRATAGYEYRIS